MRLQSGLVVAFALLGLGCAEPPGGQLEPASRADPACEAALLRALQQVRQRAGLGVELTSAHASELAERGSIEPAYARDGTQYAAGIGLVHDHGACALRVWNVSQSTPHATTSTTGDFATVPVPGCRCR
ncbi:MAG: hypothetical protein IT378_08000 [Sandaracinaceae bacterium]|nr:hypothetical protein [Sandaracinaceae bacterium]